MFKNKQSNKILLEIVEKHEGSQLKEKVQHQLNLSAPTKFNHERWVIALGLRSGNIGRWNNFT